MLRSPESSARELRFDAEHRSLGEYNKALASSRRSIALT
jgi:hypothetical protein